MGGDDEDGDEDERADEAGNTETGADVSFVIPTRNEDEYLRGTLASIAGLDTSYTYEVVVADGNSTDDTRAIAREYDATVIEADGSGIADARNLDGRRRGSDLPRGLARPSNTGNGMAADFIAPRR
ncbi:glycosyltransferase [Natronorubrum sp. JWXQ-INN-674]|uniref:Glycosyltransferase n=1 Tax=Natronorubrum halalkaliphilum TaxID=2691917 RepID=A0A6B0VU68_9EURY|nr:glycosyltransferase [Natronorubrum halalkaliphilum]